jgi:hypothetical protein
MNFYTRLTRSIHGDPACRSLISSPGALTGKRPISGVLRLSSRENYLKARESMSQDVKKA